MSRDRLGSRRATPAAWTKIRTRIWQRDGNRCHVCGFRIKLSGYECGHIVDRAVGGSDEDENLAVMCVICNGLKPTHSSRDEYDAWMARGGIHEMVRRSLRNCPPTVDELAAAILGPNPFEPERLQ